MADCLSDQEDPMTEPFVVPEPSEAAMEAAHEVWGEMSPPVGAPRNSRDSRGVAAAYAIDFPALCRQEAQKALDYAVTWKGNYQSCAEYLEARFPCDHTWSDPSKSAPPVTCLKCGTPKVIRFPEAAPERHISTREDGTVRVTASDWPTPQSSAEPKSPPCTHQTYTVEWAGCFEGPITCNGCGITGTAKRLLPSHDADFSINWVTPSAGERYTCHVCGKDYIRGAHWMSCLVLHPPGTCCHHLETECPTNRVPTPSAGEARRCPDHPPCPRLCVGCDPSCLHRPVSAGETKPCEWCGSTSGKHGVLCAATRGARPEATPLHEALGLPHNPLTPCTACACARCKAREEFVNELARREMRVAPLLDKLFHLLDSAEAEAWVSPNCVLDAARKVIRE